MKANGGVSLLLSLLATAVPQLSVAIQLTADVDVSGSQVICPRDTIIFTCTAEGAHIIKWFVPPIITANDPLTLSSPGDYRERAGVAAELVSENAMGDIVSTLQVEVTREIEAVVCSAGQRDLNVTISDNIVAPPPPQNIYHQISDSSLSGATIEFSWASSASSGELNSSANYSLYVNDELEAVVGTTTTYTLNVLYNIPYVITVADSNCVGTTHSLPYEITIVGCPLPLPPVRGTIMNSYESVIQGTGISYQCDPGLQPMGTFVSECTLAGEWHPNPANTICQADCGVPSPPVGGHIQNYCSTLENSELFYSCDTGYSPAHRMKSTCTPEGTWHPNISAFTCTIDCGMPEDIWNGVVEVNGSTTEGAVAYFYCSQDQPQLPEDKMSSTCMSNGLWVPDPSQLLCTKHGCGTPTAPVNGEITGYQSPQHEDSDLTVMFRCKDSFQPSELRTAVCAQNGSWSPNPADLMCTVQSTTEGNIILLVIVAATSSVVTFIVSFIAGISIGALIGRKLKVKKQISDQHKGNTKMKAENPLYGGLESNSVELQSQVDNKKHQYDTVNLPEAVPKALPKQPEALYDEVALDRNNSRFNVMPNVSYAST